MENEEEKLSLKMGCVQIWRCLPKERGSDTWRNRVWLHTARVWQGGLRSGKLCSKWLHFQVSEPWGHLAQKMFLEAGTAEGGKNKEKLK